MLTDCLWLFVVVLFWALAWIRIELRRERFRAEGWKRAAEAEAARVAWLDKQRPQA